MNKQRINKIKMKSNPNELHFTLLILNIISLFSLLFFSVKYLIENSISSFVILTLFSVVNIINILMIILKRKYNFVKYSIVFSFFFMLILVFIFIPSNGYSLLWFFLLPPVSILFIGKKKSLILFFALIIILTFIYLFLPQILGYKYEPELLFRILFVCIIITIIILVYEYNKEQYTRQMQEYINEIEIQKEEVLSAKNYHQEINKNLEQKNQELKLQKLKFETLIDNLDNGFAIIEFDGKFIYANKVLTDILEKFKTEILQLSIQDLFNYSETLKILHNIEKVKRGEKVEQKLVYNFNNNKKTLLIKMYSNINVHRKRKEIAIIIKDITDDTEKELMISAKTKELKMSQKRLSEQNEELYSLKEVIEQKEKRLSNILDNLGEGILIVSNDELITYSNRAANTIFESKNLIGLELKDIISESQYNRIISKSFLGNKKKILSFDFELKTSQNKTKYLSVSAVPDYNDKGEIIGTVAVVREITEIIENQQILKEKMNQLSTLINNLPAYIYFKDKDLRYIIFNDTYAELIDKDKNEIIGKKYSELFPYDKEVEISDLEIFDTLKPQINSEIFKFNKWLNLSKVPYFNHQGELKGIIGIMTDLTKQKKKTEYLKKFQNALESIPIGIIITNLQGKFEFSNKAFHNILGYSMEEINRLTDRIIRSKKIPKGHLYDIYNTIKNKEKYKGKFEFLNQKTKKKYLIKSEFTPVYNEKKEIILYIGTYIVIDSLSN